MNPIHEAGFASVVLLLVGGAIACIPGLAGLLAAGFKSVRLARGCVLLTTACVGLIFLFAAVMTLRHHQRIDHWIELGSYGPPDAARAQYGADWHASAAWTARVGLLAGGVPAILATLGWRAVRDAGRLRRGELAALAAVGASALFCAASSF